MVVFTLYEVLSDGYFYVLLFLLLAYWVIKKQRPLLKEIIISSNILSLITYLFFICHALYTLYPIIQPFNDERDIFFKYRIVGPYSYYNWVPFINSLAIFILLLFKKPRNSIWITVWMVISSAPFLYEKLIVWITNLYRNYLPSSWSVYHTDFFHSYPPLIYMFFLAITYFIRKYFINKKIQKAANLQ